MSFKEITPSVKVQKLNMLNKIRIGFRLNRRGNASLIVRFGRLVAQQLGVTEGDRLGLFVNETNPSIVLLKKSERGWVVANTNKKAKEHVYAIHARWEFEIPKNCLEDDYKFCDFVMFEGGFKVYFPGTPIEDRMVL